MGVEKAPAEKRNTHYAEIARLDNVVERPLHVRVIRGLRLSIDPEGAVVFRAERNSAPGLRHRLNSRSLCKFRVELANVGTDRFRRRRSLQHGGRKGESEGEYVIGAETRVNVPKRGKAANRESGADQEDQGHSHLQDDEHGLGTLAAGAGAAACFFETFLEARIGGFEGRREAEEDAGEQRDAHGEEQDSSVD